MVYIKYYENLLWLRKVERTIENGVANHVEQATIVKKA